MPLKSLKFDKDFLQQTKEEKFQDFHNLMSYRINDILLVSSMYDFYLFEEDGRLYELIRKEYHGLNLTHSPELVHVSSGEEAIRLAKKEDRFNLIITTLHVEDMSAVRLAKRIKRAKIKIPIALLGYQNDELDSLFESKKADVFDKVFIWLGDFRIIFGIVKYFEDRMNIEYDTEKVGVQVILLVEDSVRFYSSYLPLIYSEVVLQAQRLVSEGINLSHRFLKMRARPKILLCSNYEEAWKNYKKYEKYILGVISDINFKKDGVQNDKAGLLLTKKIRKIKPDLPILLQSTLEENKADADKLNASFIYKKSKTLLDDLRRFMHDHFAFGDFIFRFPNGEEIARASNLTELADRFKDVPEESISYHARHHHFSNWLKSRTDFWLASQLREKNIDNYTSIDALRSDVINAIYRYNKDRQQGIISDFDKNTFNKLSFFARIGGGSIGGKARGLGFMSSLLSSFSINSRVEDVEIYVPTTLVLASDIFDQFMAENDLTNFAINCNNDDEIREAFIGAKKFPFIAIKNLIEFLTIINEPLAVRSSSLLEDSQGQPFAGVYDTLMLPNNHDNPEIRLRRLLNAIKQVYASIYYQRAKKYIKVTSYHLEEEKMAVIIQKMVGSVHNQKFYPEFSGMAKSFNFYPVKPLKSEDGIVSVAFGLGKTIVEGGSSVRFSPKYPNNILQHSAIKNILDHSQKKFFAIDLSPKEGTIFSEDDILIEHDVHEADKDGTLAQVGSTYSYHNNAIYDGTSREGLKLFTLAPVLKYKTFPLPEILDALLQMGSWGMSNPIEIEFAVNLSTPYKSPKEFGILQMRPLVVETELEEHDIDVHEKQELICYSENVLGNGINNSIKDIIYVDINKFDRAKSMNTAKEISYFNAKLQKLKRDYLLIGLGRWGSLDSWLGIPITWEQISGAKAIVESNFKDFDVEPSQGSHFFQNLTSFKVSYFTVNQNLGKGFIDWDWLFEQKVSEELETTKHVHLKKPITIKVNGKKNNGIIIKP